MASSSHTASSQQSALYVCAKEDQNGAFLSTEAGFRTRVAAAANNGLGSDRGVFESIHAVRTYIETEYPDGLSRLYIRAHGSQVNGRGTTLTLKSDADGGKISLSASGEQLEALKKVCQAVQPGGTLIVEGCFSGLGKDNLLKFLASLCREGVLVVGSKGSVFEVGYDPVLNMHTRFTDAKTDEDLTRIYYTKNGKAQHIPVRQFNLLWDAFRSKIDPNDHETLQRAYSLCYQLLGERKDWQAFAKIKEENKDLIASLLEDHEALQKTFYGMPFSKKDAGPEWQAALTELEGCKDAFEYTGEEEISLVKVDVLREDDIGLHYTEHAHRYVAAYRFLLGCAAVEHYKTLLMLYDNGKTNILDNPAALLIHALSNLTIHGNGDQSITKTLANDFPTLKVSYLLAKKHEQQEAGLLQEWFTTVIGKSTGACFDNYVERNALYYFTRLAIETNLGLRVAVQNNDGKSFNRFMANGANLDYRFSDGRTIWDIALESCTTPMLANVVLAYPKDRFSALIQNVKSIDKPARAMEALGKICGLLISQKDLDRALEVAAAIPQYTSKLRTLLSLAFALREAGNSVQTEQIESEFHQIELRRAIELSDLDAFETAMLCGPDLDYLYSDDGRTIWKIALLHSTPRMLAQLVLAYPEERFSTLIQEIRTAAPARANETLGYIFGLLVSKGNLAQAREVTAAMPHSQKVEALRSILSALERTGDLALAAQIQSEIHQLELRIAVEQSDLDLFETSLSGGADLDYLYSEDGLTLWDIALESSSAAMLAKLVLAYPKDRFSTLIQDIRANAGPARAREALRTICDLSISQGNFDQALDAAEAMPNSLQKLQALEKLSVAIETAGDSTQAERIYLKVFQQLCEYSQTTYGEDIHHIPCTFEQIMQLLNRAQEDLANNIGLMDAVQNNLHDCFDQYIAKGANLDYCHVDGLSIWDIGLQTSSPPMLAKLVLAYPKDRFSTLIQDIRANAGPARAREALRTICDLSISQGNFGQALEAAEAITESLQKVQALRSVLSAFEGAGDSVRADQIRPKIFQMLSIYFQKTYAEDLQSLPCTTDQITQLLERAQRDEDHAIQAIAAATRLECLRNQTASAIRTWLNNPANAELLSQITSLILYGKNLKLLPAEIEQFTGLIHLYLTRNQLKSLPKQIGSLTALKHLDISHNQLTSLPPEIIRLTDQCGLTFNDNPWMFISDQELAKHPTQSIVCKQLEDFMQYQPQSPLGKLFQLIGTNKDARLIEEAFSVLPPELQQRISFASSPSAAASSSEGSDTGLFARSVRKAAYGAFEDLSPELKERVYVEISRLAGEGDMQWGKAHAFEHVLRFCDALNTIIG